MDEVTLIDRYLNGLYADSAQAWCEGMSDWVPLSKLPLLVPYHGMAIQPQPQAVQMPPVAAPAQQPSRQMPPALQQEPELAPPGGRQQAPVLIQPGGWAPTVLSPKKAKKNRVLPGVFVLVLVLLGVFFISHYDEFAEPIDTDEEVVDYLVNALDASARVLPSDSSLASSRYELRTRLEEIQDAVSLWDMIGGKGIDLKSSLTQNERFEVMKNLAFFGERNACQYLFRHRGFPVSPGTAWWAARGGNLDVLRYILEGVAVDDARDWADECLDTAACMGHLKVCRYLVENQGVDGDSAALLEDLASLTQDDYAAGVAILRSGGHRTVTQDKLMLRVAKVAQYLVSCGANASDSDVQDAADSCGNPYLRDFLLSQGREDE